MASYNKPLYLFLISSLASICSICLCQGVTLDLIHSDSPFSPSYNPNQTHFDRVTRAFTRSFTRHSQLKSILSNQKSATSFASPVFLSGEEYLMRVGLGAPPFDIWAIVDTGSDLTWTQCQSCTQCYKQDSPLYDPTKSLTYKTIPCASQQCRAFGGDDICSGLNCGYMVEYGDGSYSQGVLSTENFGFTAPGSQDITTFPNVTFGCGFSNYGNFGNKTSGVIGLGRGAASIVNQLDNAVSGKFSYCLTPFGSNATSKISFGSDANVSGAGVVSTLIVKKSSNKFYFLTLESVTVGSQKISVKKSGGRKQTAGGDGNIIIDSGTTLTFLPSDIYSAFEPTLEKAITGGQRVGGPLGLDLCYKSGGQLNVPTITVNFAGATVEVLPESVFLEVEDGVICSTFQGADAGGGTAIFGNQHQVNYLVGYDLNAGQVSFKKTQCGN